MNIARIDALGSTSNGLAILERVNLTDATKVSLIRNDIRYEGGAADMVIKFANGDEITISNAFGMGYGGTGPCGAVEILQKLGVSTETAERLFEYHGSTLHFSIPQK